MTENDNDLFEETKRKAFETAIGFLSICARSEQEIKDRLYKKGFHRDAVDQTLEKLKGYHYVDDEQYVKTYLNFYKNKYGKMQLCFKLQNDKGVDKLLVESILNEELSDEFELEKAMSFAVKYVAKKKIVKKDKSKLANWLYGKGFDWTTINKCISEMQFFDETVEDDFD